jgi:hypothetical protein
MDVKFGNQGGTRGYRGCEFAAGLGGGLPIIGDLNIAYAAIPMIKKIGITIGGTKYFMIFLVKKNRIGGTRNPGFSIRLESSGSAAGIRNATC